MADPLKLPVNLLSSGDPCDGNPFVAGDPRHAIWSTATQKAEAVLHRFRARLLQHSRQAAALGLHGHHAWMEDMVAGNFDIWADRGLSVVRTREALAAYDQWLFNFAESWLQSVHDDGLQREKESGIDLRVEVPLVELRLKLVERQEHWRAEARKWVAEWDAYGASVRKAESAKADRIVLSVDRPGKVGGPHLAAWLTAERERQGHMSINRLHVLSEVDRKTIKAAENGKRVRPETLAKLAKALSVPVSVIPTDQS